MLVATLVLASFFRTVYLTRVQTASQRLQHTWSPSNLHLNPRIGNPRSTPTHLPSAMVTSHMDNRPAPTNMHLDQTVRPLVPRAPELKMIHPTGLPALARNTSIGLARAAPPVATLPGLPTIFAACLFPTCLGFWKNGYAVSYSYGGAMAIGACLMLPQASGMSLVHAAAYIFYGLRLIVFLLYRELALPESVHQMVKRPATLMDRLRRLPVVLGCAFLYFCMLAPLHITTSIGLPEMGVTVAAIGAMWIGFGIAALGDFVKSTVKAKAGSDTLVTVFPFNFLRHPNYTGEFIAWIASLIASLAAATISGAWKTSFGWLVASVAGTAGIMFVLMGAAGGLEKKQKEKYGNSSEYQTWLTKSWSGPALAK